MQPPTHGEDSESQGSETFSEERAQLHALSGQEKREHRFSWSSLPASAAVLPLLCARPALRGGDGAFGDKGWAGGRAAGRQDDPE